MASTALIDGSARPPFAGLPAHVSPLLRLEVRLHSFRLVRALATGADPSAAPDLALRARQITASHELRICVKGLERILREATTPSRGLSAQAPVQRDAIIAARPFLTYIIERLREAEAPRPAGVARILLLLEEGCGPVYSPSPRGTLAAAAYRAADGL
jgi:hypothetical protein